MKNNKTVRAGSFDRNSNATAAGAEGVVGGDLYSLSDGELESIVAGGRNKLPFGEDLETLDGSSLT
jgi:hypothetical protein